MAFDSHRKAEFHPLFRRYIFGKTTGGNQINTQPFSVIAEFNLKTKKQLIYPLHRIPGILLILNVFDHLMPYPLFEFPYIFWRDRQVLRRNLKN